MSNAPKWLQWIKPAPKDDVELAEIEADIQALVEVMKVQILPPTPRELRACFTDMKRHFDAFKKSAHTLPSVEWDRLAYRPFLDQIEALDRYVNEKIEDLGPEKIGRPEENVKHDCISFCWFLLQHHGKNHGLHRKGPMVNLSSWIWEAAGGDHIEKSTWGSHVEVRGKELKKDRETVLNSPGCSA